MSTPSTQTLASNTTLLQKEPELLGETADSSTRAGNKKRSLESLIIPESKEVLKTKTKTTQYLHYLVQDI